MDKTLREYLNGYHAGLLEGSYSENTIAGYMGDVDRYMKWCGQTYGAVPAKLHRENILDFKAYLINIKKCSPQTVNHYLNSLSSFCGYLIDEGIQTEQAPWKKDNMKVQADTSNPCDLESADVEAFRQKVLEGRGKRDWTLVTVLAYAGLRISEAVNLKLEDVNIESREIIVSKGKGGKTREVIIGDKLANALKEYLSQRVSESPYVFPSRQGEKLNRTTVNKLFNQYSPTVTPHSLRHYFCSQAQNVAGFSIAETARLAGHSNIQTTMRYTHPSKKALRDKANKM